MRCPRDVTSHVPLPRSVFIAGVVLACSFLNACGARGAATGTTRPKTGVAESQKACLIEQMQADLHGPDGHGAKFVEHRFGVTMAVPLGTTVSCAHDQTLLGLPGGLSIVFSRVATSGEPLADVLANLVVDFAAALLPAEQAGLHRFAMPNTPAGRPVFCARSKTYDLARVRVACFSGMANSVGDRLVQLTTWTINSAEFTAHEASTYALMRSFATSWELDSR